MILNKIKQLVTGNRKKLTRDILISIEPLEHRVAVLENGVLEEFSIERDSDRSISGNIYKGRVHNIENGLKALFVDIGLGKNAFLHFWDAMPAALDGDFERVERQSKRTYRKRITADDIPSLYPPNSDVIVQVTKGPIGTKGPRITTNISLPGRFVVLMPYSDQSGISRKIEDIAERKRLRKILNELDVPEGIGIIIRTAGQGMKTRFFVRDVAILLEKWKQIEQGLKEKKAPALLLKEPSLVERTVRDFLTDDVNRIIADDEESVHRIKDLVRPISKRSERKVQFYQDTTPLFEKFQVNRQVENAFRRQVWLKSGAYLVIDETEALVSIDINTGRTKGAKDHASTILATNLEAAEEIARQLRLRNIGGLIVIDFIDMKSRRDQNTVYEHFKKALAYDRARTHVLPISQLGIMEMTRQRAHESINRSLYTECPSCKGKGFVKTPETMSVEIQRAACRAFSMNPDLKDLKIIIHPTVLERLRAEDEQHLIDIERRFAARLTFKTDHTFKIEDFSILNSLNDQPLT